MPQPRPVPQPVLPSLCFILVLFLLLCMVFHNRVSEGFSYYREAINLLLACWCVMQFVGGNIALVFQRSEVRLLMLWMGYYLVCFLADPGVSLYGDDVSQATDASVSAGAYVLRGFFVHIPLFFAMLLARFSNRATYMLALITLLVSPLGVWIDYAIGGLDAFSFDELETAFDDGKTYKYNQYGPYLSGFVLCGIFIAAKAGVGLHFRVLALSIASFHLMWLAYSRSRAGILFAFLAIVLGGVSFMKGWQRWLVIAGSVAVAVLLAAQPLLSDRYLSMANVSLMRSGSHRLAIMGEGLAMVDGLGWFVGEGFSAVVFSGPHTNYVRILQRTGGLGVLLTFAPFVIVLWKVVGVMTDRRRAVDWAQGWFAASMVVFTLFHSVFSYPHEEAQNAILVWFGLGFAVCFLQRTETLPYPQQTQPLSNLPRAGMRFSPSRRHGSI